VGDATLWQKVGDVFGGADSWFLARRSRTMQARRAWRAALGMTPHIHHMHAKVGMKKSHEIEYIHGLPCSEPVAIVEVAHAIYIKLHL